MEDKSLLSEEFLKQINGGDGVIDDFLEFFWQIRWNAGEFDSCIGGKRLSEMQPSDRSELHRIMRMRRRRSL